MKNPQNRDEQKILSSQKTVFLAISALSLTLVCVYCLFLLIFIPVFTEVYSTMNNLSRPALRNENDMSSSEYLYKISATAHFTEVNVLEKVDTRGSYKSVPIALTNDTLFMLGSILGVEYRASLVSANPMTGEINWQTQANANFLTVDEKHVYVESRPRRPPGAASIVAYEVNSGTQVWQADDFGQYRALGVSSLAITESSLSVETYYQAKDTFYTLDLESGELQHTIKDKSFVFMVDNGHIYEWFGDSLSAEGENGWENQLGAEIYLYDTDIATPVVVDGLILVKKGFRYNSHSIFAVRKTDGSIVWSLHHVVVSNLAVAGKYTYFITKRAELIAVDTYTGQILASVNFVPSFGEQFDFVNTSIYVAADDDLVAVYFEDTYQLSILRFTPPVH